MTGPGRFFVRMCRVLVGTALAGVVLTGCTPPDSGGTLAGDCDPNGFGFLSGCDEPAEPETQPAPRADPGNSDEAEPESTPTGDGGWPASCPQDITVTYDPDTGDITEVTVVTYGGSSERPTNVRATPKQVSQGCLDDLNRENHQFTGWLNDELDERGGR